MSAPALTLGSDHASFIIGAVSITAASLDMRRIPSLCKALACRMDGERIVLFFQGPHAQQLLRDCRQSGQIAVVFSDPPSHRTLQIKGLAPRVEALLASDLGLIAASCEAFAQALASLGYRYDFAMALHSYNEAELLALSFVPTVVFEQSPGPAAGSRLAGS